MQFSELGLSAKVLAAVEASGYTVPTPIQEQAIPHALQRRDILGIAQTGTGKTASFVLPMLTLLEKGRARARMPRTLIIEPTRELAAQVADSFTKYGLDQKINIALLIGGMSFEEQDRKIDRGVDVLIATPGRLLDHFERGKLLMTAVEILVIDEADRMLDMGFIPDIERICKLLPFTRQTLFFSATMPPEITRLTEQFLQNPVRVEVAKASSTALTVEQKLVGCGREDFEKRDTLRKLIREQTDLKNAIVFCNRKRDVSTLFKSLEKHGFSTGALHGDMDQRARMTMLHNFREDKLQVLVASDVAARGLDIPDVSHIFNFDVPIHAEDYVHRIGRTGRAGRSGKAFTLVTRSDKKYLDAIQKLIGRDLDWLDGPPPASSAVPEERDAAGGKRAKRPPRRKPADEAADQDIRENSPRAENSDEPAIAAAEQVSVPLSEAVDPPMRDQPNRLLRSSGRGLDSTARRSSSRDRTNANNRPRQDDNAPVGFGDEIPAFMLIGTGAA